MVMRLALSDANKVGRTVFDKVIGGATFGDPAGRPKNSPAAIPSFAPNFVPAPFSGDLNSKVKVNCAPGDPVRTSFCLSYRLALAEPHARCCVMNTSLTVVK
jgi:hypothetical protein